MTSILGISAFYHDSAACLVIDGEIVAAAQEERFSRRKHDPRMPRAASKFCLAEAGLGVSELDYVAFYDKPLLKFDRLLETYMDYAPSGYRSFARALPLWLKERLWMPGLIRTELAKAEGLEGKEAKRAAKSYPWKLLFGEHHESHAASAFYPSPYEEAAVLTIDGVGEWSTASIGVGRGSELELLESLSFPHSLGLLYSAFTYYLGFKVNGGEYKLMGLAPYGQPRYVDRIKDELVQIQDDGSLWLNQAYFGYCTTPRMTNAAFHRLFDGPPREPESPLTERECDIASSLRVVTEEAVLNMARHAARQTGMKRLCMAGGVALNCVANARIRSEGPFDDVWIQPAAGDAGGALGVALAVWHRYLGNSRTSPEKNGSWQVRNGTEEALPPYADGMRSALLGPADDTDAIRHFLEDRGLPFEEYERDELAPVVARHLAQERVVGLHQGRMEFGPRALGGRSILGDPRSSKMHTLINQRIKYREDFRPLAPTILREHVGEWFQLDGDSPYMLLVSDVLAARRQDLGPGEAAYRGLEQQRVLRSLVPAVTHVDYSARLQTVRKEANPLYWMIIEAFRQITDCPMVVNTSLNLRGEPICCSVADSYRCFMRTQLDILVLERFVLDKTQLEEQGIPVVW